MKNEISEKELLKSFELQHDQSDCGVACLLSLVNYYNGQDSLERLRELSGTNRQGTTLLGLYEAANQIGFEASGNEATLQSIIDHKDPLILHVVLEEKLKHYIVCYGFINGRFVIGDPAKGIVYYTKEELVEIWKSQTCLTLAPNETFIKAKTRRSEKKQWFLHTLKEDHRLLLFSILTGLIIAVLGMAMAVFSQKLIDDILPSQNAMKLITSMALIAFLLALRVAIGALRETFLVQQTKDFNNRIIDRFYSSLLNLPKPFFDTRKIGELVARLNDTQRIQRVIRTIVGNTIIDIMMTVVSLAFLFYYSWQTGLIALISLPVYFYLVYRFNKPIVNAQKEVMQGYALNESNYINTLQGVAAIKNHNRGGVFKKLNQMIYGNYQEKAFRLGKINISLSLISGLFGVGFLVAVLAFTSSMVFRGQMMTGELMAVIGIAGSLLPSIASLALVAIPINEAKIAFNRMFEFASTTPESPGNRNVETFESLNVQDLSFRFAGRGQLLKNISFGISKGECIAIVGESGCGKSTLGQILQKFYSKSGGSILVNGQLLLDEINTEDWRNITGVVPQEISIFNGSVIDNILLGETSEIEDLILFCQRYGFDKFINELPQGFATVLGETGINLSGGQKQIIAMIRALYKKPQLLILDEFTSAMDRKTEKFILTLLKKLKNEMAIIFISHRLHSLATLADEICVIENGTVVSSGSHTTLMQSSNFYSDFWAELRQTTS